MSNDYTSEIRDVNLSYLMLAQQMIRRDRAEAIFRLGISGEIADLIANMSNAQVLKMASCNVMLSRFRFDDATVLPTLLREKRAQRVRQRMCLSLWRPKFPKPFDEAGTLMPLTCPDRHGDSVLATARLRAEKSVGACIRSAHLITVRDGGMGHLVERR